MKKISYNRIKHNFKTPKKHIFYEKVCIYPANNFLVFIHKDFFKVSKGDKVFEVMDFNPKTFSKRHRSRLLKFLIKKYSY